MWRNPFRFGVGLICLGFLAASQFGVGTAREPSQSLPPPSLLAKSTVLYDLNRWHRQEVAAGGLADCEFAEPFWIGPDKLLAQDRCANGSFLSAYQIDVRTGVAHSLERLTHRMTGNDGYLKPGDWSLSPDGKWLLWKDGELQRGYTIVATRLDGSRPSRRWPVPTYVNMRDVTLFWLPGGHQFVDLWTPENTVPTEAHIYDLDVRDHAVRKVALAGVGAGREVLGVWPDSTVVTRNVSVDETKPATIGLTAFRLDAPARTQRHWTIPIATVGTLQSVSLGPDRKHLAILMASGADSSYYTLLCCQPDGSGMVTVGTFAPGADFHEMFLDGWAPDSKKILFGDRYGKIRNLQRELREVSAH